MQLKINSFAIKHSVVAAHTLPHYNVTNKKHDKSVTNKNQNLEQFNIDLKDTKVSLHPKDYKSQHFTHVEN